MIVTSKACACAGVWMCRFEEAQILEACQMLNVMDPLFRAYEGGIRMLLYLPGIRFRVGLRVTALLSSCHWIVMGRWVDVQRVS